MKFYARLAVALFLIPFFLLESGRRTPVVYGFDREIWWEQGDYAHKTCAKNALTAFKDKMLWHADVPREDQEKASKDVFYSRFYPDWYVMTDLGKTEEGYKYAIFMITYDREATERIQEIMAETENVLYAIEYWPVSQNYLMKLCNRYDSEVYEAWLNARTRGIDSISSGIGVDFESPHVNISVAGDALEIFGLRLYLKYFLHPYIHVYGRDISW